MINLSLYFGTTRVSTYTARDVESLTYGTMYPGGLYSNASFFVPGKVAHFHDIYGVYRLVIRDGLSVAWNGLVTGIQLASSGGREGHVIEATGDWGAFMNKRYWNKPWCDTRIDNNTWYEPTTPYNADDVTLKENMSIDRNNRIRFTPKAVAFTSPQYHAVRYSAPTGETVKRVTCSYDMQEAAQAWKLGLFGESGTATEWSVTASGTSTMDTTFGTASQHIWFYFGSQASQTPASDGTIYGEVSNVKVSTEIGNINLTEIAKDIRAHDASLDASEGKIASNTLSLEPFITSGYETYASILTRAASYGDTSANAWACYLGDSETMAGDTFPLPLLVVEQQPALTAADYVLRADEIPDMAVQIDYDSIYNYIIVQYQGATGKTAYVTPDEDASLADATSRATYGTRHYILDANTDTVAKATDYGQRFLAAYKNPKIMITSPIVVPSVRGIYGETIPATRVQAGKRLKISNYMNDITGSGLTLLITGTNYSAETNTVEIQTGQPDPLGVMAARLNSGMTFSASLQGGFTKLMMKW